MVRGGVAEGHRRANRIAGREEMRGDRTGRSLASRTPSARRASLNVRPAKRSHPHHLDVAGAGGDEVDERAVMIAIAGVAGRARDVESSSDSRPRSSAAQSRR